MKERGASRRRVRGGAPTAGSAGGGDGGNSRMGQKDIISGESKMKEEVDRVANLRVVL
jgi:DNA excision repair protein ERCC-4